MWQSVEAERGKSFFFVFPSSSFSKVAMIQDLEVENFLNLSFHCVSAELWHKKLINNKVILSYLSFPLRYCPISLIVCFLLSVKSSL